MSTYKRITQLDAATAVDITDSDVLVIVDVEDTTDSPEGTTKKVPVSNFLLESEKDVDGGVAGRSSTGKVSSEGFELEDGAVVTQGTGTLTLSALHNGKIIVWSGAGALTITVPAGLGKGYTTKVYNVGTGSIVMSASGTTVNTATSVTVDTQYGSASLFAYLADTFEFDQHAELATTSSKGLVELATSAETLAGTDAARAITPDGLNKAGVVPLRLVWKLGQVNTLPGFGWMFTSGESVIQFKTSTGGDYLMNRALPAMGVGNYSAGITAGGSVKFIQAVSTSANPGGFSWASGLEPLMGSLQLIDSNSDIPLSIPAPPGSTKQSLASIVLHAATAGMLQFFADHFWTYLMPFNFFTQVTDLFSAGGTDLVGRVWTCPAAGNYMLKFRVPGKNSGKAGGMDYDILIQDKDSTSYHSMIQVGAAQFQESFNPASASESVRRGARIYQYMLRMNAGQKLKLVLRRAFSGAASFAFTPSDILMYPFPSGTALSPKTISIAIPASMRLGSPLAATPPTAARVVWDDPTATSPAPTVATNGLPHENSRQYWLELYQVAEDPV